MKISNLNRVYTKFPLNENETLNLGGEHLNYLQNVLRLKVGRQFRIFNETNGEFIANIKAYNKKDVIVEISNFVKASKPTAQLTLALSIIKPDKMYDAVNMAVQIGITKFIPIIAERSQGKIINQERLSKIIIEAVEQSERMSVPTFESPITLEDFINQANYEIIIYANEKDNYKNLISIIKQLPGNLAYLVGPEGGFSPSEFEILELNAKTFSVSLGTNILRAETAVATGLAHIQLMRSMNANP